MQTVDVTWQTGADTRLRKRAPSAVVELWQEVVATIDGMLIRVPDPSAELGGRLGRDLGLD